MAPLIVIFATPKSRFRQIWRYIALSIVYGMGSGLVAQNLPYPLVTQTPSLQAVKATLDGDKVQLTLQNNGTKTVLAFVVKMQDAMAIQEFLPPANPGIAPGGEFTFKFTQPDEDKPNDTRTLTLWTVLFDDDSGEGDQATLARLRLMRRAREGELKRLLPIMDSIAAATDANLSSAIEAARNRISNAPEALEDGGRQTGAAISAIRSTRDDLLNQLNQLWVLLPRVGPGFVKKQVAAIRQQKTGVLASLALEHKP